MSELHRLCDCAEQPKFFRNQPHRRQTIVASLHYQARYRQPGKKQVGSGMSTGTGAVMIKCPETGRTIPTGIVADRASFHATPVFFARAYCPYCRTEHEWFAPQAWVCEAEPSRVEMS
jgi:hypothetical protein